MRHRFFDLVFTPAVQAEQARRGSRAGYAAMADSGNDTADSIGEREIAFIAARDSFYLASVSQTGWPYVQHRGGPVGFVRHLGEKTIGWAEYRGNRQYVSVGNTTKDDRVAMIFMDYPRRRRLKILGHMKVHAVADRPDLALRLAVDGGAAGSDGVVLVAVEAFDWNCPQHITPRFTLAEIEEQIAPLRARIAALEAEPAMREPMAIAGRRH